MSANPKVNNKFLTGGVLNINIQMQGWDKLMQATQAVQTQFITQSFDPGLQQMNTTLTTKMKEKQHYWLGKRKRGTPHMRDVTRGIRSGVLQYSTIVPVKYAQAENRRPGGKYGTPHRFAEPAINETIQSIPIFAREWQQWIVNRFNMVKP